jgi:hypothetical protein
MNMEDNINMICDLYTALGVLTKENGGCICDAYINLTPTILK